MARGVDIPEVDWVIQFDPPSSAKYDQSICKAEHLYLNCWEWTCSPYWKIFSLLCSVPLYIVAEERQELGIKVELALSESALGQWEFETKTSEFFKQGRRFRLPEIHIRQLDNSSKRVPKSGTSVFRVCSWALRSWSPAPSFHVILISQNWETEAKLVPLSPRELNSYAKYFFLMR